MNSSQGSDSPFGSPNSNFANNTLEDLEFEFHGFESTCKSPNVQLLGQIQQVTTMSSADGLSSPLEEPNTDEVVPSDGWKKFHNLAHYMLDSINLEVRALSTQLLDPTVNQSVMQINTRAFSTNRFRTKLSSLEDDLKEAIFHETYPRHQLQQVTKDIADLSFDIDAQHATIEELLHRAREKSSEKDAIAAALRQVANTPTVDLPKFDGKTINYNSFKANFKCIIQKVNGPKELWATHLVNSLEDCVKQYIGDQNSWFDKYDDLWDMLDAKYGNTWSLYHETHSAFFFNVLTSEELDPLKNHFYKQLDNIKRVVALNLNVEELCVSYLLESLPAAYKSILRDALRRLQPNRNNAAFSAAEIRKVFNDTIGVMNDDSAPLSKSPPTFLTHYSQTKEEDSEDEDDTTQKVAQHSKQSPPQQHPHSQWKTPGHHQFNHQSSALPAQHQQFNHQPSPLTPQHQLGSYGQQSPYCSLCHGQDFPHLTHHCHLFPTPFEKRTRLIQLGRCPNCTREQHTHSQCPSYLSCMYHPGETHYTWLCQGHAATGPL